MEQSRTKVLAHLRKRIHFHEPLALDEFLPHLSSQTFREALQPEQDQYGKIMKQIIQSS
jgi:hypothetical protein